MYMYSKLTMIKSIYKPITIDKGSQNMQGLQVKVRIGILLIHMLANEPQNVQNDPKMNGLQTIYLN